MESNIRIAIYSISALLSTLLILFFIVKSRRSSLLFSYLFLQIIVLMWSVHSIFMEIYSRPEVFISWNRGIGFKLLYFSGYFSACFIGFGWLSFCIIYSRFKEKHQRHFIPLLLLPPAALYLLIIVERYIIPINNSINGLLVFIAGVQYLYCITGIGILIRHVVSRQGQLKKQSALILAAVSFPIVIRLPQDFTYLILKKGLLVYNFDLTLIGFSISMLIIAAATFRYRFLNYVPFAQQKVMGALTQAVVVSGESNEIILYNNAFRKLCNDLSIRINKGMCLDGIMQQLFGFIHQNDEAKRVLEAAKAVCSTCRSGEIVLDLPEQKHFSVDIQPLRQDGEEAFGKVVTMNDISVHKRLVQELNQKNIRLEDMNKELSTLNIKLEQHASTVEELTLTRERNRFAREVHDTLGHTMTVLLTLLKVSSVTCDTSPTEARAKLSQAIEVTKEGLQELRRSINGLSPAKLETLSFKSALSKLITEFEASGVNVRLSIDNIEELNDKMYMSALFRICQEALTNALKHGGAKNVTVIVKLKGNNLKLFIADDGTGCSSIKKGYGLSGMEQRVKALNGNISFGSDGERGFNINVEIPLSSWKNITDERQDGR